MTLSVLDIALWSGVAVSIVALTGFFVGVIRRYSLVTREQRERNWRGNWSPVLTGAVVFLDEIPDPQWPIEEFFKRLGVDKSGVNLEFDSEREFLVREWTRYMDGLDRAHYGGLKYLAEKLCLASMATEMARDSRNLIRKMEGLKALGFLQVSEEWNTVERAARSEQIYLSIAGSQALVRLNQTNGLSILLEQYADREEFPLSQAMSMVELASPETTGRVLLDEFKQATEREQIRLAPLFQACEASIIRPFIHTRIRESSPPDELLTKFLQVLGRFGHPDDEKLIVPFVDHNFAPVRIQAVRALGKLGTDDSIDVLRRALGDRVWWVRYRSAQALAKICRAGTISVEQLKSIQSNHDDEYGREVLQRVMVEEEIV